MASIENEEKLCTESGPCTSTARDRIVLTEGSPCNALSPDPCPVQKVADTLLKNNPPPSLSLQLMQ